MPYAANLQTLPKQSLGKPVGNGQCVAFVERAANTPRTPSWRRGAQVKGSPALAAGTAIATFDASRSHGNHTDGRSHAAIYVSQNAQGIVVYDQWVGQPVHQRTIAFRDSSYKGHAVNDGNQFYVID